MSETPNVITLKHPVTLNGEVLKQLQLRRPKVKDMLIKAEGLSAEEREVQIVARLCGRNPEDLQELDYADWLTVQELLRSFLS